MARFATYAFFISILGLRVCANGAEKVPQTQLELNQQAGDSSKQEIKKTQNEIQKFVNSWDQTSLIEFKKLQPLADARILADSEFFQIESLAGSIHSSEVVMRRADLFSVFESELKGIANFVPDAKVTDATLKKADEELNRVYAKKLSSLTETNEKSVLKASERAWIPYRDQLVRVYVARLKGKFDAALIKANVLTKLTRERIKDLQRTSDENCLMGCP